MTGDIVEGFIPTFSELGWLVDVETTDEASVYRINCPGAAAEPSTLPEQLTILTDAFVQFLEDLSPLSPVGRSPDDLLNMLVKWLISIDAYTEEDLAVKVRETSNVGDKIRVYEVLPTEGGLSTDDQFLCARFVEEAITSKAEYYSTIIYITKIGLITDTVQDFARPASAVRKTDLIVYLDAPVAMDLLDVSGKKARENISAILDRLKEIGGSVRIFQISVEEIKTNLHSMFSRPPAQRTGPTATAIRRREVLESFAREICARPEAALKRIGVDIIDRRLDQYPNEHKYFAEGAYRDLYSVVNWHLEDAPRHHDALVTTVVMRFRKGLDSSDLFETSHVLVTKNGILPKAIRRACVENGTLPARAIGPAIHQRELATAVWLRAGFGSESNELPERYLLASCERVLQLRPDVVDKVRSEAAKLGDHSAEQLDMLLTIDRSTQVLMDKTLNTSRVVTADNFDAILTEMKRSLIAENIATAKAEVEAIRKAAKGEKAALQRQVAERERVATDAAEASADEARRLVSLLGERAEEDFESLAALTEDVNCSIRTRRRRIRWSMFILLLALALVPIMITSLGVVSKVLLALLLGLAAVANHSVNWAYRLFKLEKYLERYAFDLLDAEAARRAIFRKRERAEFVFQDEQLILTSIAAEEAVT